MNIQVATMAPPLLAHDLMRLTARSTHFVLTATSPATKLRLMKAPLTYMHTSHNELVYTSCNSGRSLIFPKSDSVNVALAAFRNGQQIMYVTGKAVRDAKVSIKDAHTIYDVVFPCNNIIVDGGLRASLLFSIIDCPEPGCDTEQPPTCETIVSDATVSVHADSFEAMIVQN